MGGGIIGGKNFRAKFCVPVPLAPTSVLTQNKGPDTDPISPTPPPPLLRRTSMSPPPPAEQFSGCLMGVRHVHLQNDNAGYLAQMLWGGGLWRRCQSSANYAEETIGCAGRGATCNWGMSAPTRWNGVDLRTACASSPVPHPEECLPHVQGTPDACRSLSHCSTNMPCFGL